MEDNRIKASLSAGDISNDDVIRALSKLLSQSSVDRGISSKTNSKLRRQPPQRGDKVTIDLKAQQDRKVKQIGEEFSFKPRNELDEDERKLMEDVESARQSREC